MKIFIQDTNTYMYERIAESGSPPIDPLVMLFNIVAKGAPALLPGDLISWTNDCKYYKYQNALFIQWYVNHNPDGVHDSTDRSPTTYTRVALNSLY